MLRMLDALDIEPGHRVLEIGTGTATTPPCFASTPAVRRATRPLWSRSISAPTSWTRPAHACSSWSQPDPGHRRRDTGVASHAPYQRIIATAQARDPVGLGEQLDERGQLLADLKIGLHAGNLVLLRATPIGWRAVSCQNGPGSCRRARDAATPDPATARTPPELTGHTSTRLDPRPWTALVPWFLAQAGRVPIIRYSRSARADTHAFTAATVPLRDHDGTATALDKSTTAAPTPSGKCRGRTPRVAQPMTNRMGTPRLTITPTEHTGSGSTPRHHPEAASWPREQRKID